MVGNNLEQEIKRKNDKDGKCMLGKDFIKKFQKYLRKYENNHELVIETGEAKLGTNYGDNYMSVLFRVKFTGRQGDGKR